MTTAKKPTRREEMLRRQEVVFAFLKERESATATQVYQGIDREFRKYQRGVIVQDLHTLAKQGRVKSIQPTRQHIPLWYTAEKDRPARESVPKMNTRDFTKGAYSASSRYKDYYYSAPFLGDSD